MAPVARAVGLTFAALCLTGLLGLSACADANTRTPAASVGPTNGSAQTSGEAPAPPHDDVTPDTAPEASATSRQAAIAAADTAVTAFARPELGYQEWINGLYPLLTQSGAAAYEDTDPENIPVHQITGPGTILDGSTEVALAVQVPTDAGIYNVTLSRAKPDAPWLADQIRPAGD